MRLKQRITQLLLVEIVVDPDTTRNESLPCCTGVAAVIQTFTSRVTNGANERGCWRMMRLPS